MGPIGEVSYGDEAGLIAMAERFLDDDAEVQAAGVFQWEDLVYAQVGGMAVGGSVGDLVGGPAGDALGVAGAVAGSRAAKEGMKAAAGHTGEFLVAVTPTTIEVLDFAGGSVGHRTEVDKRVLAFDRATVEVHITKWGLSRIVTLKDPESGDHIKMHAPARFFTRAGPDKLVMHLLSTD